MLRSMVAGLVLMAVPGVVCAETLPMDHGAMQAGAKAMSPADKANVAAMTKMMKAMRATPTGNPDRDFALMMLPHHQGAIDMAKVELQYGKDPELVAMARAIVDAQTKEIAEMNDWLVRTKK